MKKQKYRVQYMTLRDLFAHTAPEKALEKYSQASMGLCSDSTLRYKYADAMLAARQKKGGEA
jgi:hypothetical protein